MKLLATAALAMVLSAGAAATAQADPQDRGGHDHNQGGQGGNGGNRGGGQGGQHYEAPRFQHFEAPRFQGNPGGNAPHYQGVQRYEGPRFQGNEAPRFQGAPRYEAPRFQGNQDNGQRFERRFNGGPEFKGQANAGQPFQRQYHGNQNGQGQDRYAYERGGRFAGVPGGERGLRDRDRGRQWFSTDRFPHEWRAEHRFWDRDDFRPHGWYYRTWYYGDYLPWGWYAPGYYLDWGGYDLPPPPIGCEWIREGHDAVLVDVWSGEILSVEYGVFW